MARPMPRVLPVTKAVLPVRSMRRTPDAVMRGTSPLRPPCPASAVRRPGTIRLSSPASTLPGPISTNVASGRELGGRAACIATQRTGAVSCSARSRLASAPVVTGSPLALAMTGKRRVARRRTAPSASRSPSTAGAMSGEWNAPLTLSGSDPLGAARLAPLAGARRRRRIAGDDGLVGRVQVGGHRDTAVVRGRVAGGLDLAGGEAEHRRHGAGPRAARPRASARRAAGRAAPRRPR